MTPEPASSGVGLPVRRMPSPLPYSPDVEIVDPSEPELFRRIAAVMRAGGRVARDGEGPGGRLSHVQTLGALKGELTVLADLPRELAQGVFASPRVYPVVARLVVALDRWRLTR